MRKILAVAWLCLLFGIVGCLFWYNEYRYTLPTPVPAGYKNVATGQQIHLIPQLAINNSKPLFLHFFNPKCPCSRFNIDHFKKLAKTYENKASFVVVLMDNKIDATAIKSKFDLNVPVINAPAMAEECGVYSTPQAAIIDTKGKLYYRGNYNTSRYCTNKKTEFARIALDGLLQNQNILKFNSLALTAYGCSLPNCDK
ncbi:AhpC/TSA family protein [Mucilaginibacter sp. UR6-1]|uniref:TlpA family protein disulfide reductase n=1 Tax=Mucilaginibacter sp. UR6-1 TaxID=1435643 RepID=UPI001E4E7D91|nr:AhpC/TSA family protein [Mucilaginibacter sp. UR6-1]MCC8408114.1 AhpC/TSA family protein [Mucilaginibacter sp. UR6-1]